MINATIIHNHLQNSIIAIVDDPSAESSIENNVYIFQLKLKDAHQYR